MRAPLIYILGLMMVSLSACESLDTKLPAQRAPVQALANGLSAQELKPGECGIFLWNKSPVPEFVFFQRQQEDKAKYFVTGTEIIIDRNDNIGEVNAMGGGSDFSYNYNIGSGFNNMAVKGIYSDALDGGRRISGGTITTQNPEGWEEILPVSGVFVCR